MLGSFPHSYIASISDPPNRHRQTLLDMIQEYLRVLYQDAYSENQPGLEGSPQPSRITDWPRFGSPDS